MTPPTQESIVTKLLHVLYRGSVPVDRLDEAQEVRAALLPMVERVCGLGTATDSESITQRIVELHATVKGQEHPWAAIASILEKEGVRGKNGALSADAVGHRYGVWAKCQTNYISGGAIQKGIYKTPSDVLMKIEDTAKDPGEGGLSNLKCEKCGGPVGVAAVSKERKIYCSNKCAGGESKPIPILPDTKSPPAPDPVKEIVYRLRDEGQDVKAISAILTQEHGIDLTWQAVRNLLAARARTEAAHGREAAREAQKPLRREPVVQSHPLIPETKTMPKLEFSQVADAKIIAMKKRGMLPQEIAQTLERNPGGRWDGAKVEARYAELQRGGLA